MDVESRIEEVTIYAQGARVRRVTTAVPSGAAPRVRVVGLPVAVIDDTVRAHAEGGALVTAVHVGLDAPAIADAADEEAPELRAARLRLALAEAELERLEAALAGLAAAPIALALPAGEAPPAWSAVVEARRGLVALRAERELALGGQLASARREAGEARRALTAAQDRDLRAGSARTARLHELRKYVDLELAGAGTAAIHLEYLVAAARWAPSYVARLDGDAVVLELRAQVAQATGEDWAGVAIRLSTAEPERFAALPELAAQRIGRRQSEPVRAGFRAPPAGSAALYLDYARAFPSGPRAGGAEPEREPAPQVDDVDALVAGGALADEVWDEESSRAKPAFALPSPGASALQVPPGMALEVPVLRAAGRKSSRFRSASIGGAARERAGGGGRPEPLAVSRPTPPPPRLDYGDLRMAPAGAPERGTLVPASRDGRLAALEAEVAREVARVEALELPAGCAASWPHTYDHAFTADGTVDVTADAAWHSIAVTARPGRARLRHVAVPREQADVFRIAEIANPLAGPLLPASIDVYDRGRFVITSAVDHTPPGATVEIGLGVDPLVKLARNTEFSEETVGVLRGGLRLHHAIAIEIDNRSERAIDLEVRERVPVTREGDSDVEVTVGRVEPAWERWAPEPEGPREHRLRGGYRWRLAVPPASKRALRAAYDVRLAGKLELVGGNRREA